MYKTNTLTLRKSSEIYRKFRKFANMFIERIKNVAAGEWANQNVKKRELNEIPREEQFLSTKWEIPQLGARQMECSMTNTTLSLLICLPPPLIYSLNKYTAESGLEGVAGPRNRHPWRGRRDIQRKESPLVKLTHVYPDPYIFKSRTSQFHSLVEKALAASTSSVLTGALKFFHGTKRTILCKAQPRQGERILPAFI